MATSTKFQMKTIITYSLLLGFSFSLYSQSMILENADINGYFLTIGSESNKTNSLPYSLNFSPNSISTDGIGFGALKKPTLKLNPISGNVTIGRTLSDIAALNIRALDESRGGLDLRLEGDGHIASENSMFIQLDDDNNDDSYFRIRDSKMNNLFTVGETGQSTFSGDLTVTGDINLLGSINGSDGMEIISGRAFEGASSLEKSIYLGTITFADSLAEVTANINIPHNATITKVKIIYYDNSDSDIAVGIRSLDDSITTLTSHFNWTSPGTHHNSRTVTIDNLNIAIDNLNNIYYVNLESDDWGQNTIRFTAIKIFYTL